MSTNRRVKDNINIGRTIADSDELFISKTAENADAKMAYSQLKGEIMASYTGATLSNNNASTGIISFSGFTLKTTTTFDVAPVKGWIVDNSNALDPQVHYIEYAGGSDLTTPYRATDFATYLLITSASTLMMQPTNPTNAQRMENIYIGKLGHGTKTDLLNAFNEPDVTISPMSQVREMFSSIKFINDGVVISTNGSNLNINNTAGYLYGYGINWITDDEEPGKYIVTANTPASFQYRTQSGGTFSTITSIDPANYDLNGVVTPISSDSSSVATNQRIYMLQNGKFRIQYGQTVYTNLQEAVNSLQSESFNEFISFKDNSILVATLSITKSATDLSNPSQAAFIRAGKFGEVSRIIFPLFSFNKIEVNKNPNIGEFSSIEDALNSINNNSQDNKYIISVGAGVYYENELFMKPYVSILGETIQTSTVIPNGAHNLFTFTGSNTEISFLSISGVSSGYVALNVDDAGYYCLCHKLSLSDCDTNLKVVSKTKDTYMFIEYVDFQGTYKNGSVVVSNGGHLSFLNAENYHNRPTATGTQYFNIVSGATAQLEVISSGNDGFGAETGILLADSGYSTTLAMHFNGLLYGFHLTNGGSADGSSLLFKNCTTGVYSDNIGAGSDLRFNAQFIDCTTNLNINNNSTTGYYNGSTALNKTFINEASTFYISGKDQKIITVAKKGADYTSVKTAYDSITGETESNKYLIKVGPGTFTENEITMRPYIDIEGAGRFTTTISASSPSNHIFLCSDNSSLHKLRFEGSTSTSALYLSSSLSSTTDYAYVNACTFGANKILIECYGDQNPSIILVNDIEIGGKTFDQAFLVTNNVAYSAETVLRLFNVKMPVGAITPYPSEIVCAHGVGTDVAITACRFSTDGQALGVSGFRFYNGVKVRINAVNVSGFQSGITISNIGAGVDIKTSAFSLENNTMDIDIQNPYTIGNIFGGAELSKIYVNPTSTIGVQINESSNLTIGTVIIGDLYQGERVDRVLNLSKLMTSEAAMGLSSGGVISVVSGLTINVSSGNGYLKTTNEYVKEVTWDSTNLTFASGLTRYITVDENSNVVGNSSPGDGIHTIQLGSIYTYGSYIHYLENTPLSVIELGNRTVDFVNEAFGVVFISGAIVTENGVRGLDITQGERYYNIDNFISTGGTLINFEEHWRNGDGTYRHSPSNVTAVQNNVYDYGSGLTAMTAAYYAKHSLYVTGQGTMENYLLVYAQAQYTGLTEAISADLPTSPTEFIDSTCIIASIITQEGTTNIIQIRDERPLIGFNASSVSSTLIHSNLQGLTTGNAGHSQFLLLNGTTNMEANFNVGGYNIISANTVNGVTIKSHESRHLPNGLDPLTTAAPTTTLGDSGVNSVGIQNSLSRSDHHHAILSASTSVYGMVKLSSTQSDSKVVSNTDPRINSVADKINRSGDTMTGQFNVPTISATTITGITFYSGSTNIETIIHTIAAGHDTTDITRVQQGRNITTGGTGNLPTINLVASPSVNNFSFSGTATGNILNSATISASTITSGVTSLETIIHTIVVGHDTTATHQSTPVDPSTTTSTAGVMMGLSSSITPINTGTILIIISGDIDNGTNSRGATVQIRTGTGAAPINGAALTGTAQGSLINMFQSNLSQRMPFHCNAIVTGLAKGTAYWIDLSLAAVTSGTARIRNISISIIEQ